MTADAAGTRDQLEIHDRIYLERLRLAATVLLQVGEDPGGLPDTFEAELWIFRDRVERAMLLKPGDASAPLPWRPPGAADEGQS